MILQMSNVNGSTRKTKSVLLKCKRVWVGGGIAAAAWAVTAVSTTWRGNKTHMQNHKSAYAKHESRNSAARNFCGYLQLIS